MNATSVRFYSEHDEQFFFDWIGRIACVADVSGRGEVLHITLNSEQVTDQCVRELLALFTRYLVDLEQFAQYSDIVGPWFLDSNSYWHKKNLSNSKVGGGTSLRV